MKNKSKIKAGVFIVVALFLAATVTVNAEDHYHYEQSEIELSYFFSEPVITQVLINDTWYDQVTMEGAPTFGDTGIPLLPVKPLKILLPQKGVIKSINVTYEENISLGYGFNVELGHEPSITVVGDPQNGPYFDPSVPYPTELFNKIGTHDFRGYSILVFNLYPVHYIADTGEIYYYENMNVTIETKETGFVSPMFRNLDKDELMVLQKVDDCNMIDTYNSSYEFSSNSSIVDAIELHDYVIITTETLVNAAPCPPDDLGLYTFQDFADYKNSHGTSTVIVTVEEITNDPYYWNTTNPLFNDTQAQIRNFVRDAYINWGIDYVLLGGDTDVVPVRNLWYWDKEDASLPSDLYYACLDGNYNEDNDNWWGERFDGAPGGDVYEPPGSGECYAEADSMQYGSGFDVGLFTSPLNLTEFSSVALSFSCRFSLDYEYWDKDIIYFEVNTYSNGIDPDNYEENLLHRDRGYGYNKTLIFDPSDYTDPSNVYIEFYYYDNNTGEQCSLNIDDVCVESGDNEILWEGFEGNEFHPVDWTTVIYGGEKNWAREYYGVDVDLLAEVYVGRACVSNSIEVRNFVLKTLAYENTPSHDPYLEEVLMVGEKLDDYTWGGDYKDEVIDWSDANGYVTFGIPSDEYTISTLYDRDWENGNNWPPLEIMIRINGGIHIINHMGHGLNNYSMKMHNLNTTLLLNNDHCFVYSQSCLAGAFDNYNYGSGEIEDDDCFAEYITVKTARGAFAGIWNARYGWYRSGGTDGESQRYDREFWDAIYGEDITELGKANQDSKEDNVNFIEMNPYKNVPYQMCYYGLNLFGDPQLSLKIPVENNPPNKPDTPSGPTNVYRLATESYTTLAVDPEDDDIYYQWDWGEYLGPWYSLPRQSGVPESRAHMWLTLGEHEVKVRAKDIYGAVGEWSDPLTVTVNSWYGSCFLAGTQITMADGSYKNIQDIKVGDMVQSYYEDIGIVLPACVSKVSQHSADEMTDYYVIINNKLRATPNHPIYINNKFISAGTAQIGNCLHKSDFTEVSINSIEKIYKKTPTYTIEVETPEFIEMFYGTMGTLLSQAHTYFADGFAVAEKTVVVEQGYMSL